MASVSYKFASSVQWTVSGAAVDLAAVSLTRTSVSLPYASSDTGFLTGASTLLLPANVLPPKSTLLFSVKCATLGGEPVVSSISVKVNSPPEPGSFAVSPSTGVSMEDVFVFSASNWQSEQLPLAFEYGLLSSTNNFLRLKSASQANFFSTKLAAGIDTYGYVITCAVVISDVLSASTLVTTTTQVTAPDTSSSSNAEVQQNLQNNLLAQMLSSGGDPDVSGQILAQGSSALNTITCGDAPDCDALNRLSCSAVSNTCGFCKAGFNGDFGNYNSQCNQLPAVRSSVRPLQTQGQNGSATCACTSVFESCINGTCVLPSKVCPQNCNFNGTCQFFDSDSGALLIDCKVGDPTCRAVCACEAQWTGVSCSMSSADVAAKQNTRLLLLSVLSNLTKVQEASPSNVAAWLASLTGLAQNVDELSAEAVSLVEELCLHILSSARSVGMSGDQVTGVLTVLDSLATFAANSRFVGTATRRLSSSTDGTSLSDFLDAYAQLVFPSMVAGQNDVLVNLNQIATKFSFSEAANGLLSLTSPLSDLEVYAGVLPSSVSLNTVAAADEFVQTCVSVVKASSLQVGTTDLLSNPVNLLLADAADTCPSENPCTLKATLQNLEPQVYFTNVDSAAAPTYYTTCARGSSTTTSYSCPSGLPLDVICDGVFEGVVETRCAFYIPVADCLAVDDTGAVTTSWPALEANASLVVCAVTVESKNWLERVEVGSGISEVIIPATTTLSTYVPTSAPTEVPTAAPSKGDGLDRNWEVPTLVILLTWGVLLVGLFVWNFYVKGSGSEKAAVDGGAIALEPVVPLPAEDSAVAQLESVEIVLGSDGAVASDVASDAATDGGAFASSDAATDGVVDVVADGNAEGKVDIIPEEKESVRDTVRLTRVLG